MKLSFISGKSPFQYGDRLQPGRDWAFLLSICVLLFVASFAWNAWLFLRVTNGEAIGNAQPPQQINPASVDSVNALFQKRADTETQYKNGHFVDPSL